MIAILTAVIAVLVVAVVFLFVVQTKESRAAKILIGELSIEGSAWQTRSLSLEQGWDELVDSYEQQFLSFQDQLAGLDGTLDFQRELIANLEAALEQKNAIIQRHSDHCDLILMHSVEQIIEDIQTKGE